MKLSQCAAASLEGKSGKTLLGSKETIMLNYLVNESLDIKIMDINVLK